MLAALEPFDYSAHMDLLIDYVINGNYEVSRKSYFLIESRLDAVSKKKRKRYKKKLKEAREHLEGHVKLLSKTIKML
ncbi:hypothetical protein [Paenalkalicoccus suaedae]|uniref:hypothetical protein n=1 Tax=Paenalkalicoccus suaedae TaxID=2592382 RepID=UPI00158D397B|nr:hypothetical protein [Paenalkalicoccus suaedae]